ncbi:MAG TPA: tetratricopeptide repeat protein [Candidatus Limnocylindrales bacterium]|nr:tetratricopeptide repeat protein [Candidatus Limnocylindrales bacterium]
MSRIHRTAIAGLAASLALVLLCAFSAAAQAPRAFPFRAKNYDVEVQIQPDSQTISALAKVDFVASEVSRTLLVELHPDLHINSIKTAKGESLSFQRDNNDPMYLSVALADTATPGKQFTLTFDYTGPISNENDSPTKGVRFGSVDKTSAYLLLPARWFPLTNYPTNRYTGTFHIIVPDSFVVVGTGTSQAPTTMPGIGKGPGQATYVFHCERPAPVGSFVAGALQLTPVQTEGYSFAVFTPPTQVATANAYGQSLAHILSSFTDSFGALESEPNLTIAQMPDGSLDGFSAPGLLLISARMWAPKPNEELLAQLAAGQWWGDRVLPATPADVWLTDGLAHYAAAMYEEQADGIAGLHRALEDFAVGALMYESETPIGQAQRLSAYSEQYQSVVDDKGAMVFHMLRSEIGDDNFTALLKEFYKNHSGKTATIDEFEKLSATKVPPTKPGDPPLNLVAFFSQWLNSTGVPEFKMDYIVYRTKRGFKIVGKIHQDLDTFRMPVDVKVDTEGNPEFKKVLVNGTTSAFEIDTFGRPKPGGITIDPANNLLKSSPRLRVRAAVARGEAFAQQGKYFEAIQEYQRALDLAPNNSLADFRMGEAMFYQKNYQAAANSFRAVLDGDLDPKWVVVWSHIYIGKIYDLLGQRERAVNEYSLAQHSNDDTAGAQAEAGRYLQKPYNGDTLNAAASPTQNASGQTKAPEQQPDGKSDRPVLKKRDPNQ